MENLDEKDRYLQRHNLPRLNEKNRKYGGEDKMAEE